MKLNENDFCGIDYKYGWCKEATYERNKLEDCGWIKTYRRIIRS